VLLIANVTSGSVSALQNFIVFLTCPARTNMSVTELKCLRLEELAGERF
jgi:hypothetical protein